MAAAERTASVEPVRARASNSVFVKRSRVVVVFLDAIAERRDWTDDEITPSLCIAISVTPWILVEVVVVLRGHLGQRMPHEKPVPIYKQSGW